ncbi:MAG: hypothetical protein HY577_01945 [Candidatus Nealsonbacteria bacterium]|nr:hypothetical protein [Candidatus Nealsonbacteria bacterium]
MINGEYLSSEKDKSSNDSGRDNEDEFMITRHHSEETKKKMSLVRLERKERLGYLNSPETRKKIGEAQKGKRLSEKTKVKLSLALKGKKKPSFTEEHKRKLSEALKGRSQPWNSGPKCHFWKGGISGKSLVSCTDCGKINSVRGDFLRKLKHPYRCLCCAIKRRIVIITPEQRMKLSLAHRRYLLDETFFSKINTEKKAYWLGFLSGDGAITENKIRLRLANKDIAHLMKFKTVIKWTGRDYQKEKNHATEVVFRSFKMVEDLACYFVTPRKTFTVRFPDIPKHLENHFIRGVFDADGCINKSKRVRRGDSGQIYISYGGEFNIEGNCEFLTVVQSRFVALGLPVGSLDYPGKRINRIRYGGVNQLRKLYGYLYKNGTVFLERKKELFEEILKNYHHEIIRDKNLFPFSSTTEFVMKSEA